MSWPSKTWIRLLLALDFALSHLVALPLSRLWQAWVDPEWDSHPPQATRHYYTSHALCTEITACLARWQWRLSGCRFNQFVSALTGINESPSCFFTGFSSAPSAVWWLALVNQQRMLLGNLKTSGTKLTASGYTSKTPQTHSLCNWQTFVFKISFMVCSIDASLCYDSSSECQFIIILLDTGLAICLQTFMVWRKLDIFDITSWDRSSHEYGHTGLKLLCWKRTGFADSPTVMICAKSLIHTLMSVPDFNMKRMVCTCSKSDKRNGSSLHKECHHYQICLQKRSRNHC